MIRLTSEIPDVLKESIISVAVGLDENLPTRTQQEYYPKYFNKQEYDAHISRDDGNAIETFWTMWIEYEPSFEDGDFGGIDVIHSFRFAFIPEYKKRKDGVAGSFNGYFLNDETSQRVYYALPKQVQGEVVGLVRTLILPKLVQVLSKYAKYAIGEQKKEQAWHYLFRYSGASLLE